MSEAVNLREKLALIHDHWNPRIVAELNGQHVKLVKIQGPFVWHHHADEDLIVAGGGDSACEAAVACAEAGARVTLVHRGAELHKNIKYWIIPF